VSGLHPPQKGSAQQVELSLILLLVLGSVIGIAVAREGIQNRRYQNAPVRYTQAEVIAKRRKMDHDIRMRLARHFVLDGSIHGSESARRQYQEEKDTIKDAGNYICLVVFQSLENNKRVKLHLTEAEFASLGKGMQGELCYRSKSFLGFQKRD
jgi:hypothetical protein